MRGWLLLLLLLSNAWATTPSVNQKDFSDLGACLERLASLENDYRQRIPPLFWLWDRRLELMAEGIKQLRDNKETLVRQEGILGADKLSQHLLGNAIEGCLAYESRFADYAKSFGTFILSCFLTVLTLTGLIFSLMFPRFKGAKKHGPSDRPPHHRRPHTH